MKTTESLAQEAVDWKNARYKARYEMRRLRAFLQEFVTYGVPIRHEFFSIDANDIGLSSSDARLLDTIQSFANTISMFYLELDDTSSVPVEQEIQLHMEGQLFVCILDDLIEIMDDAIRSGDSFGEDR